MTIRRHRRIRPARPVPEREIQRWLDDGGARMHEPSEPTPVMWSPPALNARLEAQNALRTLPRRPCGVSAEARHEIRRIVAAVDRRELTQGAATAQLRGLTTRLHQHRRVQRSIQTPRARHMRPGAAR